MAITLLFIIDMSREIDQLLCQLCLWKITVACHFAIYIAPPQLSQDAQFITREKRFFKTSFQVWIDLQKSTETIKARMKISQRSIPYYGTVVGKEEKRLRTLHLFHIEQMQSRLLVFLFCHCFIVGYSSCVFPSLPCFCTFYGSIHTQSFA